MPAIFEKAVPRFTPFLEKLSAARPSLNSSITPITSPVLAGSEKSSKKTSGPNFLPLRSSYPVHRYPQNCPVSGGRVYSGTSLCATPMKMSSSLTYLSTLTSQ